MSKKVTNGTRRAQDLRVEVGQKQVTKWGSGLLKNWERRVHLNLDLKKDKFLFRFISSNSVASARRVLTPIE